MIIATAIIAVVWWTRDARDPSDARRTASSAAVASVPATPRDGDAPRSTIPRWWLRPGAKDRRIAGVVIDDGGAPVGGATIRIASMLSTAGFVPMHQRVTDERGRFDFGEQPATGYQISAERAGLTGAVDRVDLDDPNGDPPAHELRLVMHRCTAAIHGTVLDAAGGVIEGASLARGGFVLSLPTGVVSDERGTYELCVAVGGETVKVEADGYAPLIEEVNVHGRMRRDFRLEPSAVVAGTVVRAKDRTPVAGAIVQLRSGDPARQLAWQTTTSDRDGKFQFSSAPTGRVLIKASADRLTTEELVEATLELGTPGPDVVCELAEAYTVSGRVLERGSNAPVAGIWVILYDKLRRVTGVVESARTGADGAFTVTRVLPGEHLARADGEGRADDERTVLVRDADVTDLVFTLDRAGSIAGRVVYDGRPVDGARVRAGSLQTETDANGRFVFRGMSAHTYELTADSQRVGAFTRGVSVSLAEAEHKTGVELALDLSGSISGTVVDQAGKPISGVFLRFSLVGGSDYGEATSADDGTFTARALSGGGEYACEVRARGGSALVFPPATGRRHPTIAVKDGRSHVTRAVVRVRYERLAIRGTVLDASGRPAADVMVSATPKQAGWYHVPRAMTDAKGDFEIADLPAGSYAVLAIAAHGEARRDGVTAGAHGLALRLVALGNIRGTIAGFSTTPDVTAVRGHTGELHRAALSGDSFAIDDLPSGRYLVRAITPAERHTETIDVRAGQTTTVTLSTRNFGSISGLVLDGTRPPASELRCWATRANDLDPQTQLTLVRTDARGGFRLDGVAAGPTVVTCRNDDTTAVAEVVVVAGQVVNARLDVRGRSDLAAPRGRAGLKLADQLDHVRVVGVEPNGPAARAGVAVGDVLVSVDGVAVGPYEDDIALRKIEVRDFATPAQLVLERGDKEITLSLVVQPPRSRRVTERPRATGARR